MKFNSSQKTISLVVLSLGLSSTSFAALTATVTRNANSYLYCETGSSVYGPKICRMTRTNAFHYCNKIGGHLPTADEWKQQEDGASIDGLGPDGAPSILDLFWTSDLKPRSPNIALTFNITNRSIGGAIISDIDLETRRALLQSDPDFARHLIEKSERSYDKAGISAFRVRCEGDQNVAATVAADASMAPLSSCKPIRQMQNATAVPIGYACESSDDITRGGDLFAEPYPSFDLNYQPRHKLRYLPTLFKRYQDPVSGQLGWLDLTPTPEGVFLVLYDFQKNDSTFGVTHRRAQSFCEKSGKQLPTVDQMEILESHGYLNVQPQLDQEMPKRLWTSNPGSNRHSFMAWHTSGFYEERQADDESEGDEIKMSAMCVSSLNHP